VGEAAFRPKVREDIEMSPDSYPLAKAIYELSCELNHRPDRGVKKI
jgi:predicted trehalose synthase